MKLILGIKLILILFLILSLNAVQNETSALNPVDESAAAYAERNLTFKNWMRSSNDQRITLISGYLRLLKVNDVPHIPVADQTWAGEILAETSLKELVPYINKTCTFSKKELSASGSGVETIVFKFVRNRMELDKSYRDLLEVARHVSNVKNAETKKESVLSKYYLPEYQYKCKTVFYSPHCWFWYEWWESQNQSEKKALVTGYMAYLNKEIKEDWCYTEEERRRYDLFCKLVTVNDLVNHVDRLYKNPLYQEDNAGYIIYEYMIDNFQIYIGDPITLQG